MNKSQQPVVASFNLNKYLQAQLLMDCPQPLETSSNDFQDEEDEQDEDRVSYIRAKRRVQARRAMFDNE